MQNWVILALTVAELFDFSAAGPVLGTFVQYLFAFRSRLPVASDVVSGVFVGQMVPNKRVRFGDQRLIRRFIPQFL